jgi:hypothetical protein
MAKLSANGGAVTDNAIKFALHDFQASIAESKRCAGKATESEIDDSRNTLNAADKLFLQVYERLKAVAGWTSPKDNDPTDRSIHVDEVGRRYHRITWDARGDSPSIAQLWSSGSWLAIRDLFLEQPPAVAESSEIQALLDKARSEQQRLVKFQRAHEDHKGRFDRADSAWLQVLNFKGNAIPAGITGDAHHREYARLIVNLGRILKGDGWQERVDAITADTDPKKCAKLILLRAMEGDFPTVVQWLKEGLFDGQVPLQWGLQADSWLREGFRYEVLGIQPPPDKPLGWEGDLLQPVETVADFVKWIDNQFLVQEFVNCGKSACPSDGKLVRNTFRVVTELRLVGMPLEPTGPFTLNGELAVLRNVKRLCISLLPTEEDPKTAALGKAKSQKAKPNGGRRSLPENDPKLQVYRRIQRECRPGERSASIRARLEADKDFMELFKKANLKWRTVFKNARAYFSQPGKKQETPSA